MIKLFNVPGIRLLTICCIGEDDTFTPSILETKEQMDPSEMFEKVTQPPSIVSVIAIYSLYYKGI